jgi:hypothetical protein
VSRATSLLFGLTLALSLAACGSEESSPSVETGDRPSATTAGGESPSASAADAVVPGCDPEIEDETGWLTGAWEANDNGIYYLRQTGDDCVWWFGTDVGRSTGNTFSNVAVGRIDGDVIQLQWADVPSGNLLNGGTLTLRVSADGNQLTRIAATGGFGGATWTRLVDLPSPGASESPEASEGDSP